MFKFISEIEYHYIRVLGVQFRNFEFETADRNLAEQVLSYEGITLISQPK